VGRLARILLVCLAATAALGAAGCASTEEERSISATEGPFIGVNELTYQIQMSRILEPTSVEDSAYLKGLADGVDIRADEVWFAIFLRGENETEETHRAADEFEIVDTQEQKYRPVVLDPNANAFLYRPRDVAPGVIVPEPDTPAFNGPIQGELILFKVKVPSLYNRPLEFRISNTGGEDTGIIDIDV
jgi:hypothetical protein